MSKKYHINPETGGPGICRAKKGNCPYGGKTGMENHFDTFGEAQAASQERMSERHGLLPSNELATEKSYESVQEIKDMIKMINNKKEDPGDDYMDLKYKIRTSEDPQMLLDVINGNLYVRNDWETIGPALQNPNLPREFIDKVLNYPEDYHVETQRWIASNPQLTHKDLMKLINSHEDVTVKALALRNTSLDPQYAIDFVKNRPSDLTKIPWYSMVDNQSIDYKTVFKDWHVKTIIESIDTDDLATFKINEAYPDWKFVYEYRKNK